MPTPWILEARNLTKRFGGLTAVKALTINVARGALYGLIGPNGAGKTTVFNLLTGQSDPSEGEIVFDGTRIDGKKPHQTAQLLLRQLAEEVVGSMAHLALSACRTIALTGADGVIRARFARDSLDGTNGIDIRNPGPPSGPQISACWFAEDNFVRSVWCTVWSCTVAPNA